ncbi:protein RoBo-1-like isoform X2 [Arvicanthis niloticus]|uniref:protein RoBo-1-like isoform X2 n=1 Tax=Arvicanthis niloticus TaxID=61156 RepID=UPI00402B40C3
MQRKESYRCTQVVCENEKCPGSTATCETSVSCFSQIQNLETLPPNINRVLEQKGCTSDRNTCGMEFSITLGDQQKFKHKNLCCAGDQCNRENITLSPLSLEVNGVECPACYNVINKTCPTTTTLKCTGAEKKCVEVTLTDRSSNFILYGKGCATDSACTLDVLFLNSGQIKASCIPAVSTNGSPTLKSIASLPIVLFLLKISL